MRDKANVKYEELKLALDDITLNVMYMKQLEEVEK